MTEKSPALQQDEVVAFVAAARDKSCAIVHPATNKEALLYADGERWAIRSSLRSTPSAAEAAAFRRIGAKAGTRKMIMSFGPRAGQTIKVPEVTGKFDTLEAAAAAGLALVRLLAGDPQSWLWIAPAEYDDRGEPPAPPAVWPPR